MPGNKAARSPSHAGCLPWTFQGSASPQPALVCQHPAQPRPTVPQAEAKREGELTLSTCISSKVYRSEDVNSDVVLLSGIYRVYSFRGGPLLSILRFTCMAQIFLVSTNLWTPPTFRQSLEAFFPPLMPTVLLISLNTNYKMKNTIPNVFFSRQNSQKIFLDYCKISEQYHFLCNVVHIFFSARRFFAGKILRSVAARLPWGSCNSCKSL